VVGSRNPPAPRRRRFPFCPVSVTAKPPFPRGRSAWIALSICCCCRTIIVRTRHEHFLRRILLRSSPVVIDCVLFCFYPRPTIGPLLLLWCFATTWRIQIFVAKFESAADTYLPLSFSDRRFLRSLIDAARRLIDGNCVVSWQHCTLDIVPHFPLLYIPCTSAFSASPTVTGEGCQGRIQEFA